MRRLIAVLAVSLFTLCAAPAIAAAPKRGYYIDPKLQVYIVVNASRTAISSCQIKNADGTIREGGSFHLKSKHPKLSRSGSFSYAGKVRFNSGAAKPPIVSVKLSGSFTGGKIKGKVALDAATTCEPASYSAKYYGVNPGG